LLALPAQHPEGSNAMDLQTIFNVVGAAALGIAGWFARQLWDAVSDLRRDLSKLREELPKTYITKDDFKDAVKELKDLLVAIDLKLDKKADK
jgi:cell division protein FtsB